jgi:hypothetical protein
MNALLNSVEGRASKYSSNNYLYGRALELGGQSVASLYDATPCPLGVSVSQGKRARVGIAIGMTVVLAMFAVVGFTLLSSAVASFSNTANDPSFSGVGSSASGFAKVFPLLFGVVLAAMLAVAWVPVFVGQRVRRYALAMVARGQQLQVGAQQVDETAMRSDMEALWASSMQMLMMRRNMAAMRQMRRNGGW